MSLAAPPIPRFAVPFTIFVPRAATKSEPLPCPDCLGTKAWKVLAPNGAEHTVDCPRCATRHHHHDLPSLSATRAVPVVEKHEIRSIKAQSAPTFDTDDRVTYYSNANCCGSTFYESKEGTEWFLDEAAAREAAEGLAVAANIKIAVSTESIAAHHFARLPFAEAGLDLRDQETWDAIHRHHRLLHAVTEVIEEVEAGNVKLEEVAESLKEHVGFDLRHSTWPKRARTFVAVRDALLTRSIAPLSAIEDDFLAPNERDVRPENFVVQLVCKDDADIYGSTRIIELPIREWIEPAFPIVDIKVGATFAVGAALSHDPVRKLKVVEARWRDVGPDGEPTGGTL